MKYLVRIAAALIAALSILSCSSDKPAFESVQGDPLDARIYTLDNGLKVYMTVNKDEPRIQTYIAVRSGGKNDPADNTGLAHYLEHMMFKGTQQFGTRDYAAEKPMLEEIDRLFEQYRTLTDPQERLDLYHVIDSVSYQASLLAIPNEYDKLMSIIGSEGSNAYTSNDVTCYVEEIPSNQIENWAKIEADRFRNCVFRGFHTELEAVYEEKNMGLTSDSEKAIDAIDSMLFIKHPYGTQTVIGTQEHLKNPSLKAIRYQKDTYYVPNNMAICLSGDFDPDEMLDIIKKYFGDWEPNNNLPAFTFEPEDPVTEPRFKEVLGNDAEFVMTAWRTPGASSTESDASEIAASILFNGMAGLIDLDVIMQQKVLEAAIFPYNRTDYGLFIFEAMPKEGQTLEEANAIVLEEIRKLRDGEFSEELLQAAINNYKLQEMKALESNARRADKFVDSFINGTTWESEVGKLGRIEALKKSDITAWANKYLGPESYATVYKRLGEDTSVKKIDAPKITPIVTNREYRSEFLASVADSPVKEIEPVFVDFSRDLTVDGDLLYKKNEKNDIASLSFRFDRGSENDPLLDLASSYISYLGTPEMTSEDIAAKMYSLACSFDVRVGNNTTEISINGLSENIPEALSIVESLISSATGDPDILNELKADLIRSRIDAKKNQRACNSALRRYLLYGPEFVSKTTLSQQQLSAVTSDELLASLRDLRAHVHTILYYGPESIDQVKSVLKERHPVAANAPKLVKTYPEKQPTPASEVILAPYPSRQFNYIQYSMRGEKFDPSEAPSIELFNEYYGGGMNAIVFQEMRESRALAYSAGAWLSTPSYATDSYNFAATIASQNDKLEKAVNGFDEIIEQMPVAEDNLAIAKASILGKLRTQRTIGQRVLYAYLNAKELGLNEPLDRLIFEKVGSLTMDDLKAVHEKWIKGRTYRYAILGDPSDLDLKFLGTLGPVKQVSLEEIFGY